MRHLLFAVVVVAVTASCATPRTPEQACNDKGMAWGLDEHHVGHCGPPGFCVASCGHRRWALVPEQCGEPPPRPAPADPSRGAIAGLVQQYPDMSAPGHDFTKDTSPAPGIVVTASTEERVDHAIPGQTGITGRDGHYVIPNLPPGAYHVILFKNCNNAIREDVTVAAGKTTVVDLKYGVDAQIL